MGQQPSGRLRTGLVYLIALAMVFGGCGPLDEESLEPDLAIDELVAPPRPAAEVGRTSASFAVTDDGIATYSIPIAVPPGRNAIEPALALQYASGQSNGPLGVGWSLSGLSSIARCSRTAAFDGERAGIQFDDTDALCLDGRRLVLVDGTDGAIGAVYRPEVGTERVLLTTASWSDAAARFEVWLADGSRAYYGGSRETEVRGARYVNSDAVLAPDLENEVTLSWLIRRVRDTSGNTLEISYTRFDTGGLDVDPNAFEILPLRLEYTGEQISPDDFATHTPGQRRVDLEWVARDDATVAYVAGLPLLSGHALHRVTTSGPVPNRPRWTLREYVLGYDFGPSSGRLRLHTVQECEGNGRCLPATRFTYSDAGLGAVTFGQSVDVMGLPKGWQAAPNLPGTFNHLPAYVVAADPRGDGRPGLLYWENGPVDDGSSDWYFRRSRSDGTFEPSVNAGLPRVPLLAQALTTPVVGDMDRDGREDIVVRQDPDFETSGVEDLWPLWFRGRPSGNPFTRASADPLVGCTVDSYRTVVPAALPADFDGDGFTEPVFGCIDIHPSLPTEWSWMTRELTPIGWRPALGTAPTRFPELDTDPFQMSENPDPREIYLVDIEGDGRTEILHANAEGVAGTIRYQIARMGSPPGAVGDAMLAYPPDQVPGSIYTQASAGYLFPDVNGDGLRDALLIEPVFQPQLAMSTGRGFLPPVDALTGDPFDHGIDIGVGDARIADINADGRDDLVILLPAVGGGSAIIALSDGSRFVYTGVTSTLEAGSSTSTDSTAETRGWPVQQFADFNADGRVDWVGVRLDPPGAVYTQQNLMPFPDLLVHIEDQTEGTDITYATAGDRTVYQPEGEADCGYGTECLRNGRLLVSRVDVPDGIGGHRTLAYRYFDGRMDTQGRGWLGFARTEVEEPARGMRRTRWFNNFEHVPVDGRLTYPYAGIVLNELHQQRIDLARQRIVYTRRDPKQVLRREDARVFSTPFISQEVVQFFDFAGAFTGVGALSGRTPFFERVSVFGVDAYGERTFASASVDGGDRTTTTWTRDSAPSPYDGSVPWNIGRIAQVVEVSRPNFASSTATQSRSIEYGYDALSRVESITTRAAGATFAGTTRDGVMRFVRDPAQHGNVTHIDNEGFVPDDIAGASWTAATRSIDLTYEPEGVFLASARNSLGHIERIQYDPVLGLPVETQDANGLAATLAYDGFGRLVHATQPTGSAYDIVYGASAYGWMAITVTGNDGSVVATTLDVAGRLVHRRTAVALPGSVSTHFAHETLSYDHFGRPNHASLPYFEDETARVDSSIYDGLDRPFIHIRQDGERRSWAYSERTTTATDYNGNSQVDVLDQNLRPLRHAEGGRGATTNFEYGFFGHPTRTRLTAPLTATVVSTFVHDAWGTPLEINDPDAGARVRAYSTFGQIRAERDAMGQVGLVRRDRLGRPTGRTHPEDGETTWSWDEPTDGVGRLSRGCTNADSPSERVCLDYGYTGRGQVRDQTWQHPGGARYQVVSHYDAIGRVEEILYPQVGTEIFTARYGYDQAGMLATVENAETHERFFTARERDAFGRVTREHIGGLAPSTPGPRPRRLGFDTTRSFDELSARLVSQASINGAGTVLDVLSYDYDANGNVMTRFEQSDRTITEEMTYDRLDRLSTYDRSDRASEDYEYDALGNPTLMAGVAQQFGPPTGGSGYGPHALRNGRGTRSDYRYDPNGRLISGDRLLPGGSTRRYTWRSSGLPRTVQVGSHVTRYRYDANEQRASREAGTERTIYVGVLAEVRQNGGGPTTHVYHVFAEGREVVQVERSATPRADLNVRLMLSDGTGNVTTIANGAGVATERFAVDPWGNAVREAPSSVQDRFNGHELERATGTIDMHGRIYEPLTGRFLTPDPLVQAPRHAQSHNRYSYVFNNPATNVDPTGFQCDGGNCASEGGGTGGGLSISGTGLSGPGDLGTSAGTGQSTTSSSETRSGATGRSGTAGFWDRALADLQSTGRDISDYSEYVIGAIIGAGVFVETMAVVTTAIDVAPIVAGVGACLGTVLCGGVLITGMIIGGAVTVVAALAYAAPSVARLRAGTGGDDDRQRVGDAYLQVLAGLSMIQSGVTAATVLAREVPAATLPRISYDGYAERATWAGDPRAQVRFYMDGSQLVVSDVMRGAQPSGSGGRMVAMALRMRYLTSPTSIRYLNLVNQPTLDALAAGVAIEDTLVGRMILNTGAELGASTTTLTLGVTDRGVTWIDATMTY